MLPIVPYCKAIIIDCSPRRYIGRGCTVLKRAYEGQVVLNISAGTRIEATGDEWFVDLGLGDGQRIVGCVKEKYLMRIDGYSRKDLRDEHIGRMRQSISKSKLPTQYQYNPPLPPIKKK